MSRSALYSVVPVGELEIDPDYPSVGFQSARARIIAVVENDVRLTQTERARRGQHYELYKNGRHIHDAFGRLWLSAEMQQLGLTQEYLDLNIPRWTSLEDAARMWSDQLHGLAGNRV